MIEQAVPADEGVIADSGPLAIITAPYTGRSPNDKFIVREPSSEADIWWGKVNVPVSEGTFERLHQQGAGLLPGRGICSVKDAYAGADPEYRLRVRIVSEMASPALFAQNMFLRPPDPELADFLPEFTVFHAPHLRADPAMDGMRSEAFVVVHFGHKLVLIGGTGYAGEIKKSIFTVMNYLMAKRGVLPMHCSANVGADPATRRFSSVSPAPARRHCRPIPSAALIGRR